MLRLLIFSVSLLFVVIAVFLLTKPGEPVQMVQTPEIGPGPKVIGGQTGSTGTAVEEPINAAKIGVFERPGNVPGYRILEEEEVAQEAVRAARLLVDTRAKSEAEYELITRDPQIPLRRSRRGLHRVYGCKWPARLQWRRPDIQYYRGLILRRLSIRSPQHQRLLRPGSRIDRYSRRIMKDGKISERDGKPVSTRSTLKGHYALIVPGGHVESHLPGWEEARCTVLISPEMGARFVQLLIELPKDAAGHAPEDRESFLYVLDGRAEANGTLLKKGGYCYVPPGTGCSVRGGGWRGTAPDLPAGLQATSGCFRTQNSLRARRRGRR